MTANFANISLPWGKPAPGQVQVASPPGDSRTGTGVTLASVLYEFGPFPTYSLVIGQCLDGLPFMLGLDNPNSGAVLVVGERDQAKIQVLSTMGASACRINHPEEVAWSLISRSPRQYPGLVDSPHCQDIVSPFDRAAGDLVVELASLVEQRRFGRERGGMHVLMIDDFRSFAPVLSDYSVYLNLKTMVSKGPACGVWPLISARPDDAYSPQGQILRDFGTYIFEKNAVDDRQMSPSGDSLSPKPGFQPAFNAIVGGRLIPISGLPV